MRQKMGFMWQQVMTSSVFGPRSSKALPKARLAHGHCLVVCCWSDPLRLFESWQNHYIWEVCSANWWDAPKTAILQLALVNKKGPILHDSAWLHITQPTLQKLNELGYEILPHLPSYLISLFKHLDNFLPGKRFPQPEGGRKCFLRVCCISKHGFLCYRNKLIS